MSAIQLKPTDLFEDGRIRPSHEVAKDNQTSEKTEKAETSPAENKEKTPPKTT